jgi:hypothetical protein
MSYQSISRKGLYNTSELCVNLCHLNVINFYLSRLGRLRIKQFAYNPTHPIFYNLMVGKRGFETRNRIVSKPLCSPLHENHVKVTIIEGAGKILEIPPSPAFIF